MVPPLHSINLFSLKGWPQMAQAYSSWLTVDRLPDFMPGIAPITRADATLFADRYLKPDLQAAFVTDHRGGNTLVRWWFKLDDNTRHALHVDCILGDSRLPYNERLEAIERHPMRAAYLATE